MKLSIYIFDLIIFLNYIVNTFEDICSEKEISISALGNCKNITDILDGKDLALKKSNLFYLSSNNEGRIEKGGYKLEIYKLNDTKLQSHNIRRSQLYIPKNCLDKMEKNNKTSINKNKGIIIVVHDSNNLNANNIPDNYFIIFYINEDSSIKYINSKNYDFSFCHEDPILLENEINFSNLKYPNSNDKINIEKIIYGRQLGIDLFDPSSKFLKDICFKFKSEKGTDVPLESRLEDYYQNITFCNDNENSHYISYNYSSNTSTFNYRCAIGYYKSENDKSSYLDTIDTELKSIVSISNIKIIKCYKSILVLKDIIRNYGGMICIFVIIYQIICFLIFCFCGIKSIEDKIGELFILGKKIIRRLSRKIELNAGSVPENEANNINNGQKPRKLFNLWRQVKILKEKGILIPRKRQRIEGLKIKVTNQKKQSNPFNSDKNDEKESEEIRINKLEMDDDIVKKGLNNKKEEEPIHIKTNGEIIEDERVFPFKKGIKKNEQNNEFDQNKSEDSQIYDYEMDELNELPFDKAIKYDKRNFCVYYGNILLSSHIILSVFFRQNDYNLFTIKLGLLFMTFPININFNILFFTSKNIKLSYIRSMNDISSFWNNITNSIYSSILASILLIILKVISLTHNSVRTLRKLRDINQAEKKSVCILRCIKIRIVIYYILSFIFLIVFGFYVLCFCSIFENTQIELIKSTVTSWLLSIILPFLICFLTSLMRSISLVMENKYFYAIKQIMQML